MLTLLVALVVLGLVGWGARAVMAGLGAPPWLVTVVLVLFLVLAVVLVAGAFGVPIPAALR